MDVKIGVTQTARELTIDIDNDEATRTATRAAVDDALSGKSAILRLVDRKGRELVVPAEKIAYVEIGSADGDRRMGFGA
jgi:hypothetical protein